MTGPCTPKPDNIVGYVNGPPPNSDQFVPGPEQIIGGTAGNAAVPLRTSPPLPVHAPAGMANTRTLSSAAPEKDEPAMLLTKLIVLLLPAPATNWNECGIHPMFAAVSNGGTCSLPV